MSAPTIQAPRSRAGRVSGFEQNTWLFMRASGVLLLVLVFGHLFVNLMTGDGIHAIDFAFVAGKWANPFWQVWDLAMLWLAGCGSIVPSEDCGELCGVCPPGQIACGGQCINPLTDDDFCGASADCEGTNAGAACAAPDHCNGAGVCGPHCQDGFVACDGTCINPMTDDNFCGASGDCTGDCPPTAAFAKRRIRSD